MERIRIGHRTGYRVGNFAIMTRIADKFSFRIFWMSEGMRNAAYLNKHYT